MEQTKIAGVIAREDLLPYLIAFSCGLATALALASFNGSSEAWSAGNYYWFGIPVMCLQIFFTARQFPHRAWRWTVSMALGQVLAAILRGSTASLGPIAILFVILLSIPQFAAGALGVAKSSRQNA